LKTAFNHFAIRTDSLKRLSGKWASTLTLHGPDTIQGGTPSFVFSAASGLLPVVKFVTCVQMSSSTGCRCLPVSFITIVFIAIVTLQPLFPVAFSTNPRLTAQQPESTDVSSHTSSSSDVPKLSHLDHSNRQSTNAVGFSWKHTPHRVVRSLRNVRRLSLDRYHRDGSNYNALPDLFSTCSQATSIGARPPCNIRAKTSTSRDVTAESTPALIPLRVIEVCDACGQYWASIIGLTYCCRCNEMVFAFCQEAYFGFNYRR
jgi:hypothetical protein